MPHSEAMRFNSGKPKLSYVMTARYAVEGLADVMEKGAEKYAPDNWKLGLSDRNCIDSMLRHITKYLDGEGIDPETGCHHLDHALANALFLAHHHNGKKEDELKRKKDQEVSSGSV